MNNHIFSKDDKIDMHCLLELPEVQRMGFLVNQMLDCFIKHQERMDWINKYEKKSRKSPAEVTRPLSSSADQFRTEIWEHYQKAMVDPRQVPSGPLLHLNQAEYYAWCLKQEVKRLKLQRREKS